MGYSSPKWLEVTLGNSLSARLFTLASGSGLRLGFGVGFRVFSLLNQLQNSPGLGLEIYFQNSPHSQMFQFKAVWRVSHEIPIQILLQGAPRLSFTLLVRWGLYERALSETSM